MPRLPESLFVAAAAAAQVCAACSSDPAASPYRAQGTGSASCPADTSPKCPSPAPSYEADVAPILAAKCDNAGCHDGRDGGPWPLTNKQDVVDWWVTVTQDVAGCTMPPADAGAHVQLTNAEQRTLLDWIACVRPAVKK